MLISARIRRSWEEDQANSKPIHSITDAQAQLLKQTFYFFCYLNATTMGKICMRNLRFA